MASSSNVTAIKLAQKQEARRHALRGLPYTPPRLPPNSCTNGARWRTGMHSAVYDCQESLGMCKQQRAAREGAEIHQDMEEDSGAQQRARWLMSSRHPRFRGRDERNPVGRWTCSRTTRQLSGSSVYGLIERAQSTAPQFAPSWNRASD
jgi:hypothetical protein